MFERQASLVKPGLPVSMSWTICWDANGGTRGLHLPDSGSDTRTLRVRMRFDNADHLLKPNMFAQVQIHNETASDILSVPREAVIRGGGNNRVVLALGEAVSGRCKAPAAVRRPNRSPERSPRGRAVVTCPVPARFRIQ